MPRLVIRPAARADLAEIQDYIAKDSPRRARSFTREIVEQCRNLASLPGTHGRARPELRPDLRSYAYKGYLILFRYTGSMFEVVSVIEGHRDIEGMRVE